MASFQTGIVYSILIPIYNESDNILSLTNEIECAMANLLPNWELIFIDDGSIDTTPSILSTLSMKKKHIRHVHLEKNYGQSSALLAGIDAAKGEWLITLDGDGQNDPSDIPKLLELAKSGSYDLVTGIRKKRKDVFYKRFISKIANTVRKRVLLDNAQDSGCSLKLFRRTCALQLFRFRGMHRFLPALFQIEGFSIAQIPVNHRERMRGKSKYHLFNRGISLLFDMLAVGWMKKRKATYTIKDI